MLKQNANLIMISLLILTPFLFILFTRKREDFTKSTKYKRCIEPLGNCGVGVDEFDRTRCCRDNRNRKFICYNKICQPVGLVKRKLLMEPKQDIIQTVKPKYIPIKLEIPPDSLNQFKPVPINNLCS